MSLLLRRKVEKAITEYLKTNAAEVGLTSGAIIQANSQTERPDPCLVVACLQSKSDEDLDQIADVEVVIQYIATGTVNGSERDAVDIVIDKVHTFLMKPVDDDATWSDGNPEGGALRLALNKPAEGDDERAVKPLHFYDFFASEGNGDIKPEGWVDELVYTARCQPMNSH